VIVSEICGSLNYAVRNEIVSVKNNNRFVIPNLIRLVKLVVVSEIWYHA